MDTDLLAYSNPIALGLPSIVSSLTSEFTKFGERKSKEQDEAASSAVSGIAALNDSILRQTQYQAQQTLQAAKTAFVEARGNEYAQGPVKDLLTATDPALMVRAGLWLTSDDNPSSSGYEAKQLFNAATATDAKLKLVNDQIRPLLNKPDVNLTTVVTGVKPEAQTYQVSVNDVILQAKTGDLQGFARLFNTLPTKIEQEKFAIAASLATGNTDLANLSNLDSEASGSDKLILKAGLTANDLVQNKKINEAKMNVIAANTQNSMLEAVKLGTEPKDLSKTASVLVQSSADSVNKISELTRRMGAIIEEADPDDMYANYPIAKLFVLANSYPGLLPEIKTRTASLNPAGKEALNNNAYQIAGNNADTAGMLKIAMSDNITIPVVIETVVEDKIDSILHNDEEDGSNLTAGKKEVLKTTVSLNTAIAIVRGAETLTDDPVQNARIRKDILKNVAGYNTDTYDELLKVFNIDKNTIGSAMPTFSDDINLNSRLHSSSGYFSNLTRDIGRIGTSLDAATAITSGLNTRIDKVVMPEDQKNSLIEVRKAFTEYQKDNNYKTSFIYPKSKALFEAAVGSANLATHTPERLLNAGQKVNDPKNLIFNLAGNNFDKAYKAWIKTWNQ